MSPTVMRSVLITHDAGALTHGLLARDDLQVSFARDAAEAQRLLQDLRPSVCLSGENTAEQVLSVARSSQLDTKIIVLFASRDKWNTYMEAGAAALVPIGSRERLAEALADVLG